MAKNALPEPLSKAIELVKKSNLSSARLVLEIDENQISNNDFINQIIALEHGFDLATIGNQVEALVHFKKALPIINHLKDPELRIILLTIVAFCEGVTRLLNGDAHGALSFFNAGTEIIEKLSFFNPYLEKSYLYFRAICHMALVRIYLNNGDIHNAESSIGNVYNQFDQLIKLLNEKDIEDNGYFADIYGANIEYAIVLASLDLQSLDFENMDRQLKSASKSVSKLTELLDKIDDNQIKRILEALLNIYTVLKDLHRITKNLIILRSPLNKNDIIKINDIGTLLFNTKKLAELSGERGRGVVNAINRLEKFRLNLLSVGKINKSDFGRFSGIVSLITLIILIIVIHLIIRLPELNKPGVLLLEVIMSLITGFGYGAIRFRSLLKIYSNIIKK
jgi:hypothetical protein